MRGDKGIENRMIVKHMILLRNNDAGSCISGRSKYNTRIERFCSEYNTNAMRNFCQEFEELKDLNLLEASNNADLWCLHFIHMDIIQNKIEVFKNHCNNHLMQTMNDKLPLEAHASSSMSHEVCGRKIDLECISILNNWLSSNSHTSLNNAAIVQPIDSHDFPQKTMELLLNIKIAMLLIS